VNIGGLIGVLRSESPLHGKCWEVGLGSLSDVELAEARERAAEYRKQVKRGFDPIADRQFTYIDFWNGLGEIHLH